MVRESGCVFGTLNGPFSRSVNSDTTLVFVRGILFRLPSSSTFLKLSYVTLIRGSDSHTSRSPNPFLLFDLVVHRSPGYHWKRGAASGPPVA